MEPDGIWNGSKMKGAGSAPARSPGKPAGLFDPDRHGAPWPVSSSTSGPALARAAAIWPPAAWPDQLVERPDDAGQQGDDDEDREKVLAID